jgi:hypothetical protein
MNTKGMYALWRVLRERGVYLDLSRMKLQRVGENYVKKRYMICTFLLLISKTYSTNGVYDNGIQNSNRKF